MSQPAPTGDPPVAGSASHTPSSGKPPAAAANRWWVLAAMTGAACMATIDATVVSVALPRIQRDLAVSSVGLQWIVNAYVLALAVAVVLGGRLGDVYGQVRVFVAGVALFALGSTACALAPGEGALIAARAAQGLGAALMQPASAALVIASFPLEERGKAMGIYGGVGLAFLTFGPLLGGLLTQLVSWHAVFWINVPVAAVVLALTVRARPPRSARTHERLGLWPLLLFSLGTAASVVAVQQGSVWGWTAPLTWLALGGGLAALGAFLVWQWRAAAPVVPLQLFRQRAFAADAAVMCAVTCAMVNATVFGAIYFQNILGFSPLAAGVGALPLVLPITLGAPLAGVLFDRLGVKPLAVVGSALIGAGFLAQALVLAAQQYWLLVPGMLLLGAGIPLVLVTYTDALNRAPEAIRGAASALLQTLQQLGSTVGLATIGAVIAASERARIAALVAAAGGTPADEATLSRLLAQAAEGQARAAAALAARAPTLLADLKDAVAASIAAGYLVSAAVGLLAFLLAVTLMRPGRQQDDPAAPAAVAAPARRS